MRSRHGFVVVAAVWWGLLFGLGGDVHAATKVLSRGNAEAGQAVFHGKGVCHYCHGVEGSRDKRPELEADTAALITRLNPPPADLRNPKALHLKNDAQRARAIREGHPGTGMFPDTTMTDQELADVLAYLARLRNEARKE